MKRKCFTFVEILGCIAVIGILAAGTAFGVNAVWRNNQTDICESELRNMTAAFKNYITDYGSIVIEPDANYENTLTELMKQLNCEYLPYEICTVQTAEDKHSVSLTTLSKTDPWHNKYAIDIYTYADDENNIPGMIVIASSGADAQSSRAGYGDGNFGDDIIAVVEPNE